MAAFSDSLTKRSIDIATALLLGVLLAVVALPLFLLIHLDSPGPAIFRQERIGRNGQVFQMFKFRTMRVDAEGDGVARWAQCDDPRVTSLGRFLRATHLDELPQAVNVLRGEMSAVGPRPERPEWATLLDTTHEHFHVRHLVKPGMTGLAQVHHRYTSTLNDWDAKLSYDLQYVQSACLSLELMILLRTVPAVLRRRGI